MGERIDKTFLKRVALYLLVLTAVFVVLPVVVVGLSAGWRDRLYNIPAALGLCFALSWAMAYRRQFYYPETFAVLKTGAVWTGILLGAGMVITIVPRGIEEFAMSNGEILLTAIFFMVGGMLSGPVILAFWVIVLHLVWRRHNFRRPTVPR